jgi:hypothetical protein
MNDYFKDTLKKIYTVDLLRNYKDFKCQNTFPIKDNNPNEVNKANKLFFDILRSHKIDCRFIDVGQYARKNEDGKSSFYAEYNGELYIVHNCYRCGNASYYGPIETIEDLAISFYQDFHCYSCIASIPSMENYDSKEKTSFIEYKSSYLNPNTISRIDFNVSTNYYDENDFKLKLAIEFIDTESQTVALNGFESAMLRGAGSLPGQAITDKNGNITAIYQQRRRIEESEGRLAYSKKDDRWFNDKMGIEIYRLIRDFNRIGLTNYKFPGVLGRAK